MKPKTYHDKLILAELNSHILDTVDELMADGYSQSAAEKLAQERFGNLNKTAKTLKTINHPVFNVKFSPLTWVTFFYCAITSLLVMGLKLPLPSILQDFIQIALFWLAQVGVIGITMLISYWVLSYIGLHHHTWAWASYSLTFIQNCALIAILDIDHFEVLLHNLILLGLFYVTTFYTWEYLDLTWRKLLVYTYIIVSTVLVLINHRLFEWLYQAKCLFITPDAIAVASCVQVWWFSPLLWPIYLALIVATSYLGYGLVHYWKNAGSSWARKIISTSVIGVMLVLPWFIHDINNQSELDILPWKYQINHAYQDILGRNPETKDMNFYATSRAFEHMLRVRETLYNSTERQLKIHQIYQQILQRNATAEEIQRHNQHQQSIGEIYYLLTQ